MAKTKNDIRAEGRAAFAHAGSNPYKEGSWQAEAWLAGFGEEADEAAIREAENMERHKRIADEEVRAMKPNTKILGVRENKHVMRARAIMTATLNRLTKRLARRRLHQQTLNLYAG